MKLDPVSDAAEYRRTISLLQKFPNSEADFHVKVKPVDKHLMEVDIRNGKFKIFSDEPGRRGGFDRAPSAMELFVAGLALCQTAQFVWNAADMEIPLDGFELEMSGFVPLAGWVGLRALQGMSRVEFSAQVESGADESQIRELTKRAVARCPAGTSVMNVVPMNGVVHFKGKEIPTHQGELVADGSKSDAESAASLAAGSPSKERPNIR